MGTDQRIVRIAERRNHMVTTRDLERLGLNDTQRRRRAAHGAIVKFTNDVYATTVQDDSTQQWELAVCLSRPDVVLSHGSAAAFWGLRRAPKGKIEVTIPKGARLHGTPAVVHYSNLIPDHHIVEIVDGRRVTSVARTVFDLGGTLDVLGHRSLIEDVRNKALCTDAELGDVYRTMWAKGRRGSAAWTRLADLFDREHLPVMSEPELALQEALIAHGLPPAVQQHPVQLPSGRTVLLDLAYPAWLVDIEVDHAVWHSTVSAVENDKARDVGLATVGWATLRFTERAMERPAWCVQCVADVLERRGWTAAAA